MCAMVLSIQCEKLHHIQRDRMIQEQHQVTKGQKGQIMRWHF